MSYSRPSPYFFLPVILVQVDLNPLFQKWSGLSDVFLAKTILAMFAHLWWTHLVKSSLDCRHWQWHIYLLESVLLLTGCYERGFLYHGEDPTIIHQCCPLWTSRPFYVAELNSAFFFFLRMYQTVDLATPNVPAISLMDLFWFWSLIIVCFTCMERSFDRMMWVQSIGFQIWHN